MAIRLTCVFESGREETIRDYDDFTEAIEDALSLANAHGADPGDSAGPPKILRVYRDAKIEFSVSVIRGGLRNADTIDQKVGRG